MVDIKLSTEYLIFNHIHIFLLPYCLLSVFRIRSGHQHSLHRRQSLSFLTLSNTCLCKTLICLFCLCSSIHLFKLFMYVTHFTPLTVVIFCVYSTLQAFSYHYVSQNIQFSPHCLQQFPYTLSS